MLLSQLLKKVKVLSSNLPAEIYRKREILNICTSLPEIKDGSLFIAIKGINFDGHTLCERAEVLGASVIISQKKLEDIHICNIVVSDTREALALIAANYYENPADDLILAGITGTNGKTTTSYMLHHILTRAGYGTGIIGTVGNRIGNENISGGYTTPEPMQLHSLFQRMRQCGIGHGVMEVSSHALDQKRVAGLNFEVGIFTNLTLDHLDYHKTFENYRDAKLQLFKNSKHCLANADSLCSEDFLKVDGAKSFSLRDENADYYALNIQGMDGSDDGFDIKYDVKCKDGTYPVKINMPGLFNVYNSLAAFGGALLMGINPQVVIEALATFEGVKGRMEYIKTDKPFNIIIDFAHTPDGLLNLLVSSRPFTKNRIIVVFGCGGDRDKAKRPMMGQLADLHSDVAIVTSDNPRSESPERIVFDIMEGTSRRDGIIPIVDRREAIAYALSVAKAGDTVLIAGKGHETYQIIGDKKIDFDEREIIFDILGK